MRLALLSVALERTALALGVFGLWFTYVQIAMLPDESRRAVWYGVALAFLLAALALRALRLGYGRRRKSPKREARRLNFTPVHRPTGI